MIEQAPHGFSLRERVRSGTMTPSEALTFLDMRESQGHRVSQSIRAWLRRQEKRQ